MAWSSPVSSDDPAIVAPMAWHTISCAVLYYIYIILVGLWFSHEIQMGSWWNVFFLSFYGLYMKIRCRPWPGLCSFAQVTEGLVPSIRSDLLPCFVDCIHDFCSTKNWKGVHCPPDNPRHVSSLHCNASSQAIFQMSRWSRLSGCWETQFCCHAEFSPGGERCLWACWKPV